MWQRLRHTIARSTRATWRRSRWLRDLLDQIGARRERQRQDSEVSAARSRFWADVRAGQREAEADASRRER